jgi:prevent-host-death family protein
MERVGIRELKQHASAVIRRVAAGEEVEVTDRGTPVARIVPLPKGDPYDRLVLAGEVTPATMSWRDLEPGEPVPGKPLSRVLQEMRDEDDR